jgi:hypothetical protein
MWKSDKCSTFRRVPLGVLDGGSGSDFGFANQTGEVQWRSAGAYTSLKQRSRISTRSASVKRRTCGANTNIYVPDRGTPPRPHVLALV